MTPAVRLALLPRRRPLSAANGVFPFVLLAPAVFIVALVVLYPLARLIVESVGIGLNLRDYTAVVRDPTLWRIILITLTIAAECTLATLVLGYPLACLIATSSRRVANILLLLVLVPFWTSILVRMYAWMALLGPQGPLNRALMALTGARTPYHLLYDRFAVIVGMTHYLLPFMVLSIFATMRGIDRQFLEAARSMGSSAFQVFTRIFFPLSLPGVYAGTLLVFILAIGFYVTPALLGGPADTTIAVYIEQEVELLEWGHATAMAVVLVALVVVLFVLYDRVLGFNRLFRGMGSTGRAVAMGQAPGERWPRVALWAIAVLVLAFLVLPLVVVVPESFSAGLYLQFPPPGWSLQWYRAYFGSSEWIRATLLSLEIAGTVAVLATVLGCLAAVALARMHLRGKAVIRVLLMTPMIVPTIVVAISAYSLYSDLRLVATFAGIVLAHTVLALPFAVMLLATGFEQVDVRFEEASATMGASGWYTFRRVALPLLRPSLASAALFAFVTSWDEIIMVIFIGGGGETTLPLKMFSYLRTEINPVIAAVSTLLLALVCVVFAISVLGIRRTVRGRAVRAGGPGIPPPEPHLSMP